MENNKPIKSFKAGAVRASVFANAVDNGQGQNNMLYRVVIDRSYKDRNGNWKSTNGFLNNEVPKAILVLQLAYKFLAMKEHEEASSSLPVEEDIYQ